MFKCFLYLYLRQRFRTAYTRIHDLNKTEGGTPRVTIREMRMNQRLIQHYRCIFFLSLQILLFWVECFFSPDALISADTQTFFCWAVKKMQQWLCPLTLGNELLLRESHGGERIFDSEPSQSFSRSKRTHCTRFLACSCSTVKANICAILEI